MRTETHAGERATCRPRQRGGDVATSQGIRGATKQGETRKGPPPTLPVPTPGLRTSGFRNSETMASWCFKSPSLRYFALAALRNKRGHCPKRHGGCGLVKGLLGAGCCLPGPVPGPAEGDVSD